MKFENTEVFNLEGALRGMRNPLNSWDKSDSYWNIKFENENDWNEEYQIGPNDMKLATTLGSAGPEHRKYLRQIFISVDITGPIYWWKEMDTYKVGTTANSTSTMHKLATTPITLDCFDTDDFVEDLMVFENEPYNYDEYTKDVAEHIIDICETLRKRYLETKDIRYWKELIRWLPSGWLQTRTWTADYEVLKNIYHQRKNHKLSEWHSFCSWVESLPYAKELIMT